MQSSRESGHVEILMPCQVRDPGRGSFMVNPVPVKLKNGQPKTVTNPAEPTWPRLHVMRAGNHITQTRLGMRADPHPEAFDYAVNIYR